jgi:LmbE family N-acetylglucosaminyl deacetylase
LLAGGGPAVVKAEPLGLSVWSRSRWLVLAPHPDDETLGAGALIAEVAREGRLAGISYLTDGSGSHPVGTQGLSSARRSEACLAIRRLAPRPVAVEWIGWKDAHPPSVDSMQFAFASQRLGALLRRTQIDAIAVTDLAESHCDHVAAFHLAASAVRSARRAIDLFAYRVWSADTDGSARRIRTARLLPGRRRSALCAHRSQLTPAYGEGFRLPKDRLRMAPCDTLTLCRRAI